MKKLLFLLPTLWPLVTYGIRNPFYFGCQEKGELIARAFLHKKKVGLRMYAQGQEIHTETYATKSPST